MSRLVDLSLDIYDRAPTFWPDPKTAVIPHLGIANMKYNITQLVMSTHLGTHLDAPFHFFDNGRTVEQVDPGRGFGPAWVLDFSGILFIRLTLLHTPLKARGVHICSVNGAMAAWMRG